MVYHTLPPVHALEARRCGVAGGGVIPTQLMNPSDPVSFRKSGEGSDVSLPDIGHYWRKAR